MVTKTSLIPLSLTQNPSPLESEKGQEYLQNQQALVNEIMQTFMAVLPSNYVSLTNGPWYTLQFQAIAEQLALIQISAQEILKDSDFDFTRPEFLWEVLGTVVFPRATERNGAPIIEGDQAYRTFLRQMVLLLLQGSTVASVASGVGSLTTSQVTVVERFLDALQRNPKGAWTIDNQFELEILVDGFPTSPFLMQSNMGLVLEALKPAHTLYEFSHLFQDAYATLLDTGGMSWGMQSYYYDDTRRNQGGVLNITGTGATLTDRTLFSDPTKSFASIKVGSTLKLSSGVNAGQYRVVDVQAFPVGTDTVGRAYTTSPTGLVGFATIEGAVLTDLSQDWSLAEEGEQLTLSAGPNAGNYRLDFLLGSNGGPLSKTGLGPSTSVRVSLSILRLERRMPYASVVGQAYVVGVDRLGVKEPLVVVGEDVSSQFYL